MTVQILFQMAGALNTSYINERFCTSVRSSGFGLGYSLAIILPLFYAFYQTGFASLMPSEHTILPILSLGGLLTLVGAALGPETKDVDFFAEASAPLGHPTGAQRGHQDRATAALSGEEKPEREEPVNKSFHRRKPRRTKRLFPTPEPEGRSK